MARPRMHRKPLTVDAIGNEPAGGKDKFLWDGTEHGLGVKVTPTGMKVFILQKAVRKRLTRITLGKFPDMKLDAARLKARKLNGVIADGRDPIAEEKAAREADELRVRSEKTVQELWDRYEVEVIAAHNKPRTADEKRRMWKRRINPALGKLKLKDVTGTDASTVVRSPLRIDAAGRVRGGKGEAGNLYRLLKHMFSKAELWGMRPRDLGNPLKEVDQPRVERRERLLAATEVTALEKALSEAEEHPQVIAVIRAALMTGARIDELLTLPWKSVRAAEKELHLTDTKSGKSKRPISADAVKLFQSVGRVAGSPFVFRSITDPQEPLAYTVVRQAFDRIAANAGVEGCTLHTLRHWFVTHTANKSNNPRVGMRLTGHKSLSAYMNYVHADSQQAHDLADEMATALSGLASAPSNVVPAKKKRA
jgi:integrase